MKHNTFCRLAGFAALATAALGANASQCFDFSNMAEDARYTVGDVIETDFATIRIRPYVIDGQPAQSDVRRANRAQTQIAGGTAPELELKLVALVVEPKMPVSRITTRIAQNISDSGGFADSGAAVNKKGLKSPNGFAAMDGKTLGSNKTGRARISANIVPSESSNWHSGTLEFNAVVGAIERIRLGAHTWRIDNFCMEP